jgi:hypothetical protein
MNLTLKPTYCKGHEKTQKQRLKKRFKFKFQTMNKTRLHDSKTKTQELKRRTWDVQDKHGNNFLLC